MKKILLLIIMCVPALLSAQNGVTVSNLAVNAGTVTFDVRWDKNTIPPEATPWSDTVWVFVDYNNNGVMTRLPLLPGATLTATSALGVGKVKEEPGNNKGVWVIGDARINSSFSATVQLLTATANLAGACAYASNYPPVGDYISATNISFTGTPPYDLVFKSGNTLSINSNLYVMPEALESFTDKTGAPGRLDCIPLPAYDLKVSAAGFCAGGSGVTFALSGTQSGRAYLLYKDGSTLKATLPGTGGAATFTGTFNDPGVYTARTKEEAPYCTVSMNGSHPVVSNALPVAPVIPKPDDACLNSGNNIVFEAKGYSGTVDWVSNGGGSVNNNTVTFTSSATGTKTVVARAAQTYTDAPTCYSADVTQSTTVHALPAVATSSGASRCGNGTVTLSATASSGALIDWYAAASGGTALLSGNNAYTTPSLNTNTTYYAEARNTATGCVSARTAVLATINAVPGVPSMGGGGSQCGGTRSITATAGANGTGIRWTDNSSTASPRSVSTTGTYYAVTTNSTTGCESGTASVSVTINAVPAAPTGASANSRCGSGVVAFSATVPSGITIDWYNASSGGSIVSGGSDVTSFSPSLTQTTTYYAAARNTTTSCVSSSRLSVTGTVIQYGADGSAPGDCGCAPGLQTCSGTCQASCGNFTPCSGITEVSDNTTEGTGNWAKAITTCAQKGSGWRLPTLAELTCMCNNIETLPGAYTNSVRYWTGDSYEEYRYSVYLPKCGYYYDGINAIREIKCVK